LADLAVRQDSARRWIDYFGVKVIFPNVRSVFALDALTGNAGTDDFRQPIVVDGVQVECVLDLSTHGIGPRLSAAPGNLERALAGIDTLGAKFIKDREQIARCDEDND